MKTGIIILAFNKLNYTKLCIESVRKYTEPGTYEIIVVDNASSDDTAQWLSTQTDLKVIYNKENLGFPKGCNQGIEIASDDCDSILLLNNDTVVTENWLANLRTALFSEETIGATGSITNSISYSQAIKVDYKQFADMQKFASKINVSNPDMWEERIKLVGFCMLIKKIVVDKIGGLEEIFTPGNFEDDDYSVRIRKEGYRLLLCRDSFIHHFGSASFKENSAFADIMATNYKKFVNKWNFDPTGAQKINHVLVRKIQKNKSAKIKVLDIGCRLGGTLLEVKAKFPQAELHGVEWNAVEREHIAYGVQLSKNMEDIAEKYSPDYFDVILISEIDSSTSIDEVLKQVKVYLKKSGELCSIIPNPDYYKTVASLELANTGSKKKSKYSKKKSNVSKKKSKELTVDGIVQRFTNAGFDQNVVTKVKNDVPDKVIIEAIGQPADNNIEKYKVENFYVHSTFKYEEESISKSINDVLENPNHREVVVNFLKIDVESVYRVILEEFAQPDQTTYDLAFILDKVGCPQHAHKYLIKIENPNEEIKAFISDVEDRASVLAEKELERKEITHALRRIENDVLMQESILEVIEWLGQKNENLATLKVALDTGIIQKVEVLNQVATTAFKAKKYNVIIPLLQQALEYEPNNPNTLYNFAYILSQFGEKELAKKYLGQIKTTNRKLNDEIKELSKALCR